MTVYGITPAGFVIKRFEVILQELIDALKAASAWGPGVNVLPDSPLGQLLNIFGEREALVWELAQDVYDSQYPDSASGASLDNVSTLIGVERLPSTQSIVVCTFTGTSGTLIPAGSIVSTNPGGNRFFTLADLTIPPGGSIDGTLNSDEYGPIAAPAGTLKTIITKVSGWVSVINDEDADMGEAIESDPDLRIRRLQSLQIGGRSTVGGMFANLLQTVEDVTAVLVVENETDIIDAEGRPPHSVESIVKGGTDQNILDAIWDLKPAGIQTAATSPESVVGTVVDSEGYVHTIRFSRPSEIDVWMHIEIEVDSNFFNVGSKQKNTITVLSADVGKTYTVGINGTDFSYVAIGGDDEAKIAEELEDAIATGLWVPVDSSYIAPGADEFFTLTSKYEGNPFTLEVSDEADLEIADVTPSSGDQSGVEDAVQAYAEIEQNIGVDVIRSKYFTPINSASQHILSINVRISETRWPGGGPTGGETNIEILASEIGDLDTTRTTIEVMP